MEEELLLHPPTNISLPGLRVPRKRKAEVPTAITESALGRRGASGPSPALTPWTGPPCGARAWPKAESETTCAVT